MVRVVYEGRPYDLKDGDTLLDGLLAHQVDLPHGCKAGSCQSCLLKCTEGDIPETAQKGLREAQKINRYFLACQCLPISEMHVGLPQSEGSRITTRVERLYALNAEIMELTLKPERPIHYKAGQFIRLYNPQGIARSYSLASVPEIDRFLTLHVRAYPDGVLSQWVHQLLRIGDMVSVSEALGECFYVPGQPEQPLLLIGTGSGLAPLYGILRDALQQGHTAPIYLYHGARSHDGLYLFDDLKSLAKRYSNFEFRACVSDGQSESTPGILSGRASDIALNTHPDLKGWAIYLCGNPDMVRTTQMQAFLAGCSLDEIHADAFDSQSVTSSAV